MSEVLAAPAPAVLNRAVSLNVCPSCMALLSGCSAETIAGSNPAEVLRGLITRVKAGHWLAEIMKDEKEAESSSSSAASTQPTLQQQLETMQNRPSTEYCTSCLGLLCDPINVLGDEIYEHVVAAYPTAFASATFALEVVLPVVIEATRLATRVIVTRSCVATSRPFPEVLESMLASYLHSRGLTCMATSSAASSTSSLEGESIVKVTIALPLLALS
jgi:predicted peroxiredoxin/predicted small metal-binding protein